MSRIAVYAWSAFALVEIVLVQAASAQTSPGAWQPGYYRPATPAVLGRSGLTSSYGAPQGCSAGYCGSTGSGKPCCADCRPGDCANGRCAATCRGACCSKSGACCSECRPGDCARGLCSPNCRGTCCKPAVLSPTTPRITYPALPPRSY